MIGRIPIEMDGGVNLWADATKVKDNQLTWGKNIVPIAPGQYGTRPAMKWVNDILWKPVLAFWPTAAKFSPIAGRFAITFFVNDSMILATAGESIGDSITLGPAPAPLPTCLVQWDGDSYAFTGVTSGARLAYANNAAGYIMEQLNFGAGNTDFHPKGAAVIRDRFVYWGFDDGAGGRSILFADRGQPLVIGNSAVASARFIPVAGIAQSGITHCAEINTNANGSPNQSVVAVWTTDRMWTLLGEPGETGDGSSSEAIIGSLQQNLLTVAAGCVSGATVAQTPYGTIWAGPDDVWFMPFGALPIRVGTNIRPALMQNPPGLKWKWHAEYDADKAQYRLAIFSPDCGPTEYHGCDHHWILDLSRGAPTSAEDAKWYGPCEYEQCVSDVRNNGTYCLLSDLGATGTRITYGVCAYNEVVSASAVYGVSLVVLDASDSLDSCAPFRDRVPHADNSEYFVGDEIVPYDEEAGEMRPYVWRVTAVNGLGPSGGGVTGIGAVPQFNDGVNIGFVDGGVTWAVKDTSGSPEASFIPRSWYPETNVIRLELSTKEMMGDVMVDKLIDGAELGYWCDRTGRFTYRFLNDVAENTRVIDAPPDQLGVVGFEAVTPPNPPTIRAARNWKSRLFPGVGGRRSVAKSIQFWTRQDTVFVVDDTNDKIVIGENDGLASTASVTHGEYTYAQLLEAVRDAIQSLFSNIIYFATDLATGSLEGIGAGGGGNRLQIYFQRVGPGATTVAVDSLQRCARLFQLLGFDVNAAAAWGAGVGVEFIEIQAVGGTPTTADYTMGRSSNGRFNSFRVQFSGLNVRAREFKRRPQ